MKKALLIIFLIIPFVSFSQDIITLKNGKQIDCKITKIDSTIIFYDFYKGDRSLSSYVDKKDIHSYRIFETTDLQENLPNNQFSSDNTVIIDTTKYQEHESEWINLITYSRTYGFNAAGWLLQYYGFNQSNISEWSFPIIFSIERFQINEDYFSQFDYYSAEMNYFNLGLCPFYHYDEIVYFSLGVNLIFGNEKLVDWSGHEIRKNFVGLSPTQGVYFISKSKSGIVFGISLYEKILSSKVYKEDIGLKFDFGIKF